MDKPHAHRSPSPPLPLQFSLNYHVLINAFLHDSNRSLPAIFFNLSMMYHHIASFGLRARRPTIRVEKHVPPQMRRVLLLRGRMRVYGALFLLLDNPRARERQGKLTGNTHTHTHKVESAAKIRPSRGATARLFLFVC